MIMVGRDKDGQGRKEVNKRDAASKTGWGPSEEAEMNVAWACVDELCGVYRGRMLRMEPTGRRRRGPKRKCIDAVRKDLTGCGGQYEVKMDDPL